MESHPCEQLLLECIEPNEVADLVWSNRMTNEQKCLLYCFVYTAVKADIEMPRMVSRLEPAPAALTVIQDN